MLTGNLLKAKSITGSFKIKVAVKDKHRTNILEYILKLTLSNIKTVNKVKDFILILC